jgi:NADH dehydrogenase
VVVGAGFTGIETATEMPERLCAILGRVAGYNAVAELVGLPLYPCSQPKYVTCLDLGPWGALYTEGWDRQLELTREEGKAQKRAVNTEWIYPPAPDRDAAFALARPDHVIVP